ncbi:MAG: translation elongation factor-like protein [Nitrospirota bacterium]
MKEQRIGIVSHYYNHLGVAAVIMEGELSVGDTIHIKGHTTDFIQKVESIQIEHKNINQAKKGDDVGIKVKEHARDHDVVYKVMEE